MRLAVLLFASLFTFASPLTQAQDPAPPAESKPEAKPEPKPEPKPESKPEAKPETAATTAAPKPADKPTDKPGDKPAEKPSDKKVEAKKPGAPVAAKKTDAKFPEAPKSLIVEDLAVGKGKSAIKGKTVKVHYTGWLYDPAQPLGRGRQIDSSLKRGEPWSFLLGAGQVIKGWDEGFKDMKVGGKRRLVIPSDMAYGTRGARREVPPNTSLVYEVELLDVLDVSM